MPESKDQKKKRVGAIVSCLKKVYPDAKCALEFETPFQLLVATILSAQCTDKRVNMVTPDLFKKYPSTSSFAKAKISDLEKCIKSTGFYRNKAKSIQGAAKVVMEDYGGKVPPRLEDLVKLPGTGRKTANVVLGNAFGVPGIPVDTHMIRINRLLQLTRNKDAVKIEFDLMPLVLKKDWTLYSHLIIHHGRARCKARKPECPQCEIQNFCPSKDLERQG